MRYTPENLYSVKSHSFEAIPLPTFRELRNKDYVLFGENNLYPQKLIELFQGSAIHHTAIEAKTAAIKLVMDIESKRIDMLQKAGLLENKELAEEMMEIEHRQEVLVSILKDIASEYPQVRDEIMRRLSLFAKDNEVITVVHDVQ